MIGMGFAVFIHRADSIYNDRPAEQYQFPRQYLDRAEACIGNWIIYYEPQKVTQTRGYFAIAKVEKIVPDPTASGMYLAIIDPPSYLPFPNPVPFKGPGGYPERELGGRGQWAVRPISNSDFNRIIELGLAESAALLPRIDAGPVADFEEVQTPYQFEQNRDRVNYFSSRIVRDRVFRRVVLRAYGERCAITGLKLINGGGRGGTYSAGRRERPGYCE